ncbi:hypothetical protein N7535_008860 [Penicillium sp. DV-2018c]|nr:hypothetical protein N7461_002616 [Penicillium sp. DV-2018c]KAJ5563696.1 hypothetical protein N7535_008860 [Penicillium sp. DV-2018c]
MVPDGSNDAQSALPTLSDSVAGTSHPSSQSHSIMNPNFVSNFKLTLASKANTASPIMERIPLDIFSGELLRPQSFDWAEECEDLERQADDALSNDILRPQSFNWADESEELEEVAVVTDQMDVKERAIVTFEAEFKNRTEAEDDDADIHHWNWLGNPVYHPVATPPADSLAIIQTPPKAPKGSHEYRVTAITNSAMQLVDPVLVETHPDDGLLLSLHGTDLIRECEGRVFKPWNCWPLPFFEVGNGLYENGPLISARQWVQWQAQAIAAAQAPSGLSRKTFWTPSRSPLSNCETHAYPESSSSTSQYSLPPSSEQPPTIGPSESFFARAWTWVPRRDNYRVFASWTMAIIRKVAWTVVQSKLSLLLVWPCLV